MRRKTILLYGRSGAGKSAQIGNLARWIKATTGLDTRVYHIDNGGYDVLQPHIDLGFLNLIEQGTTNPWVFLKNAVRGYVRDSAGKWIPSDLSKIGLIAFEGMTAFADALMVDLADSSAKGVNVGGASNVNYKVEGDGDSFIVGGNNMAHYGIVQNRITKEVWASQKLQVPYIVWTASASKDDDTINSGKILGPAVVGKALTSEVPRWFHYTFRMESLPAKLDKAERHVLHLGVSTDTTAGNAVSLGNSRVPLGANIPSSIEPADVVLALTKITEAESKVKEDLRKELSLAQSVQTGA